MNTQQNNTQSWLQKMEFYRLPILGISLMLMGAITVPAALLSMNAAVGQSTFQFVLITLTMFTPLVANLAAMPVRKVLPLLAVCLLVQIVLTIVNAIMYMAM